MKTTLRDDQIWRCSAPLLRLWFAAARPRVGYRRPVAWIGVATHREHIPLIGVRGAPPGRRIQQPVGQIPLAQRWKPQAQFPAIVSYRPQHDHLTLRVNLHIGPRDAKVALRCGYRFLMAMRVPDSRVELPRRAGPTLRTALANVPEDFHRRHSGARVRENGLRARTEPRRSPTWGTPRSTSMRAISIVRQTGMPSLTAPVLTRVHDLQRRNPGDPCASFT